MSTLCAILCDLGVSEYVFIVSQKKEKVLKPVAAQDFFLWSEYRDSNPRPLGPEPSAIPNFAIPRNPIYYNENFSICQSKYWIFCCPAKRINLPVPVWNNKEHHRGSWLLLQAAAAPVTLQREIPPKWQQQQARRAWRLRQKMEKSI